MPVCSLCGIGQVLYRREHEGTDFCRKCFVDSIETKVRHTVTRSKLLEPDDRVAVALSGGKDSVALLRILRKLEQRFPPATLVAVTVDEGIAGYRDEAVVISRDLCNELKIDHVVVSFDELFGINMDDIASRKGELMPCSYCGVLRRKALNEAARRAGATKLATAHNLDDETQTAFLNIVHGDVERIMRPPSLSKKAQSAFIPRIKPLAEIPERETALYAYASGSAFQTVPCPHGHDALRGDIRVMLNRLELKHPGVKHTIHRSMERLSNGFDVKGRTRVFQACTFCGDPTPNAQCEACKMLSTLKSHADAVNVVDDH